MAKRIMTWLVAGLAVVLTAGCETFYSASMETVNSAMDSALLTPEQARARKEHRANIRAKAVLYYYPYDEDISSYHRSAECPYLAGEYQCNSPRLGIYTMKISQETNTQGAVVYTFQKNTAEPWTFISGSESKELVQEATLFQNHLDVYRYRFCRDNSLYLGKLSDGGGGDGRRDNIYTPLGSGDLDIESQLSGGSGRAEVLINFYNVDCKRKR